MNFTHFRIQIFGWSKPRFFSTCEGQMFFHVGGCPAKTPCGTCQLRMEFVRGQFRKHKLPYYESVTPSGYLCFAFTEPGVSPISTSDPVEFMERFLEAEITVLNMFQADGEFPE